MHYLKQMKRLKYKITLARILLFAGFITLWEVAAYTGWIDDFIFSSPSRIIKTLFAMISDGSIFYHTAVTVAETGISFALIVLLGVGTAILLWSSKMISAVLEPYLVLLNSLPKSALAPMIIVWLGNNAKAIIVTAISVGVFGTILNIYTSFAETDSDKILLIQTLGGSRKNILTKVVLPASLKTIISNITVIPTEYEELIIAEDGFVLACKQDKWGALDIYGRTILPCVYQWVYYDVSAKVWIAKSLAMGLYNSQGALLLPGRIDYIGSFVDGKAPVWLNSVLGWIDTKGQLSDGFAEDVTESFLKEEKKGVAGAWGMFNLLTDLIPDYAMAHYYMGKGQVTDGIYSKGMEHLKIAAELDPDNGEVALALKQAKKDKKKRTLNTIGYIASVHNDLESTNSNSFKDESRNQNKPSSGINLGVSMDEVDALGGLQLLL